MRRRRGAKFYGISASFDSFSNKDETIIIQYQAKYVKDIGRGGGYVKVGPRSSATSPPTSCSGPTSAASPSAPT